MIFARKVNKISEFHMIFAPKMPIFYVILARKIFFRNFGGHVPSPLPPFPTPMAVKELLKSVITCQRYPKNKTCTLFTVHGVLWWRSSVVVSTLALINVVNQHRARLILGWVTACGR